MSTPRQDLDNNIENILNDSVADFSLKPSDEANAIKIVADYVDEFTEFKSNKSQDIDSDTGSEDKYPSVKAIEDYISSTNGVIDGALTTPYPILEYDINTITGNNTKVSLPSNAELGKIIYVKTQNNCYIYSDNNGLLTRISTQDTNSYLGNVYMPINRLYKFIHIGGGFWVMSDFTYKLLSINGQSRPYNDLYLSSVETGTSAPTLSNLSTAYDGNDYPVGYKVFYPNITGGGKVYTKIATSQYYETSIGTLIT